MIIIILLFLLTFQAVTSILKIYFAMVQPDFKVLVLVVFGYWKNTLNSFLRSYQKRVLWFSLILVYLLSINSSLTFIWNFLLKKSIMALLVFSPDGLFQRNILSNHLLSIKKDFQESKVPNLRKICRPKVLPYRLFPVYNLVRKTFYFVKSCNVKINSPLNLNLYYK